MMSALHTAESQDLARLRVPCDRMACIDSWSSEQSTREISSGERAPVRCLWRLESELVPLRLGSARVEVWREARCRPYSGDCGARHQESMRRLRAWWRSLCHPTRYLCSDELEPRRMSV